jgi:transposase
MLELLTNQKKKKKNRTTSAKRAQILLSLQKGYTTRAVGRAHYVNCSTVSRIRKKWLTNHTLEDLGRVGRPTLLDEPTQRRIVNLITSRRCSTAVEVRTHLKINEDIEISVSTIRRILRNHGLVSGVKKKKPYLSDSHRKTRLAFAKKYEKWTVEDWSKVIWSDESRFQIFGSDGKQYYWKRHGEPLNQFHVKPTMKYGGGSIMIWGCFTSRGVGSYCKVDGTLDTDLYLKILREDLMWTIEDHGFEVGEVVFQQDGASCHTATLTKRWLTRKKIKFFDWPPQSADLNPIEHLWDEVDRRLRDLPGQISSEKDLWEKIQKVWQAIDVETCMRLIRSMPERIRDVIRARGGYTRW